jgi:uncharacterized small protein (DUF1192 family)
MLKLEELKTQLLSLQAEIARTKSEGRVLMDCWIAKAKPGGSKKNKYPRLKSRKPMFDGKKTEYLSIHSSAVAEAEAALARGKAVKKLEKRIQGLSEQVNQLQDKSGKSAKLPTRKKASQLYTPPEIIDLVRVVMGEIDLDPASDEIAQKRVQARNYYTPALDGLSNPWFSRVWLHPPADGKTAKWTSKLLDEYESGRVTEAILLVKPSAGSKWFQKLTRLFPVCFPDERLKFLDDEGIPQPQPKHGNAISILVKIASSSGRCLE